MWDWIVKHHRHVIVILILIVTLQLTYSDISSKGPFFYPSRLLFEVGSYVLTGIAQGANSTKKVWSSYIDLVNVKEKNAALIKEVKILRMKLRTLEDVKIRYDNILNILNMPPPQKNISYITAMVIGSDANNIFKSIMVNKGRLDGINEGDGVISASGVVGRVVKLSAHASEILLLTDGNSYIEAIDKQTRVRGIVNGIGINRLKFMYILSGDKINKDDTLLTGGKGGIFPEGIAVGKIISVKNNPAGWLFKNVIIKPAVNINKLDYVMIISGEK